MMQFPANSPVTAEIQKFIVENERELASIEGNLLGATKGEKVAAILVTSCHPREGKTVAAVSMAWALASIAKERVLLVDTNFYAPRIHEIFKVEPTPGLADLIITPGMNDAAVVRRTAIDNLSVVPSGADLPNKHDVFESEEFRSRLDALKASVKYVVADGPSVLGSHEAAPLSRFFDGVVLVIECEKTKWEVVQQARDKIANLGGRVLGAVLNRRRYHIPRGLYGRI